MMDEKIAKPKSYSKLSKFARHRSTPLFCFRSRQVSTLLEF